jgi:Mrp family chromosome partitioning ATPase
VREQNGRTLLDPTAVRGLALRLRQFVPDKGGTILFSPIVDSPVVDDLVASVSRFLGMRDERVLIVDTRLADPGPAALVRHVERPVEIMAADGGSAPRRAPGLAGLVQFLVFEGHDVKDFIHSTGLGSVDLLPAGGPYPLTDVLASEPMKEMLNRLRKEYSVILMVGPAATHTTDTEILAAYVHGMVVVLNGQDSGEVPLPAFFQSLREANAPLLGSVLCV